jgi:hypothetical protein
MALESRVANFSLRRAFLLSAPPTSGRVKANSEIEAMLTSLFENNVWGHLLT